MLFREGKGETDGGIGRAIGVRQIETSRDRDRRLDLGLQDAPRSTTYTTDQTKARKGRIVRWHQETVHK